MGFTFKDLLRWRAWRTINELRDDQEGKFDAADFPTWEPPLDFNPDDVVDHDAMLEWWLTAEKEWKDKRNWEIALEHEMSTNPIYGDMLVERGFDIDYSESKS